MSVPVLRIPLSLSVGIGLAALGVAAGLAEPALAANATVRAEAMPAGFGRLAFSFDTATPTRIRVANGVLVIAFGETVKVDVAKVARDLPAYISVARNDPDGRGLRFALARPYKANLIEAGDKVFVDLLPENWTGLLPGPPQDVIASLAERLRLAEARNRDQSAQPPQPRPVLAVRGATLPTLNRLVFQTPPDTGLTPELVDGMLRLTFDRAMTVEPGPLRSTLPEGVALAAHATTDSATQLDMTLPQDWRMRSFRDEDGLVVDLVRPGKPPALPPPAPTAETPSAKPAAGLGAPAGEKPMPQPAAVAAAQAKTQTAPDASPQAVKVQVVKQGEGARIDFHFPRPVGAAAFTEAGMATLVFDTRDTIDPAALKGVLPGIVEDATVTREGKVTLVRLRLVDQPLTRLVDDGAMWSLAFGEDRTRATDAIAPRRTMDDGGQTIVSAPLPGMTGVHWLDAGPGGLPVAVATATGPTRLVPKPYQFIEFALLPTAHGLAVSPRADDLVVRAGADQALIGRAGGLTVTLDLPLEAQADESNAPAALPPLLDAGLWSKLQSGTVREASRALLRDVADASRTRKSEARLALARFYAANGLMPEAAGPLGAVLADDASMRGNREALFLKGLIATRMHRNAEALKAWDAGPIREDAEPGLWRALVEQRLGRSAQALAGFRRADAILDRYPAEVQAEFRIAKVRAALAQQDLTIAEHEIGRLANFPAGLVDPEQLALLRAMLDDASGRPEAALNGYKPLFEARSRPVAAEAQLRAVRLVQTEKRNDMTADEAISRLETVAVTWRGGDLEIEALAELGRLYTDAKRWRDAFLIARRANESFSENPLTRRMHDETAQRFAELFTGKDAEALPRIDALALFYDFKEFLPIGRRGDEITRLLADRLVELDLLDQASEILNHQMQKRLTGAARSTIAARLAMIALMNGKPADALRAIHTTRLIELPADVKRARLLLEAKALSDLSRIDQALEMLEPERGPEVDRLRADIYWTGRRWREAGESHERMLAESWRGEAALSEAQRADVMRAAISYVMAGEALSLDRLRSKFAAKMVDSADARTFAFVTGASRARAADIREMARNAAGADTLSDFMRAYRERYPAYSTAVRQKPKPEQPAAETPPAAPSPQGAAPAGAGAPGRG